MSILPQDPSPGTVIDPLYDSPITTSDSWRTIEIPQNAILFHGTCQTFRPELIKPWAWLTTNICYAASVMIGFGRPLEANGPYCSIIEYRVTRPLRLLLTPMSNDPDRLTNDDDKTEAELQGECAACPVDLAGVAANIYRGADEIRLYNPGNALVVAAVHAFPTAWIQAHFKALAVESVEPQKRLYMDGWVRIDTCRTKAHGSFYVTAGRIPRPSLIRSIMHQFRRCVNAMCVAFVVATIGDNTRTQWALAFENTTPQSTALEEQGPLAKQRLLAIACWGPVLRNSAAVYDGWVAKRVVKFGPLVTTIWGIGRADETSLAIAAETLLWSQLPEGENVTNGELVPMVTHDSSMNHAIVMTPHDLAWATFAASPIYFFHHFHMETNPPSVEHCGGPHVKIDPRLSYVIYHCPCRKHAITQSPALGHDFKRNEVKMAFHTRCPYYPEHYHLE